MLGSFKHFVVRYDLRIRYRSPEDLETPIPRLIQAAVREKLVEATDQKI
jgi:hypothetical protein